MMKTVFCSLLAATAIVVASSGLADIDPPGPVRDRLTFDEIMAEQPNSDGPIHNDYFMPIGVSEREHHTLSGVLEFPGLPGQFPSFNAAFFTSDGYLVPVERDIIRSALPGWDIILSPGRVWSEPPDEGWSRASFPFVLTERRWNDSHNGLATFLYNDTSVSDLQFQIVQETAWKARFSTWSRAPLMYQPGSINEEAELTAAFSDELARTLPTAPLTALGAPTDLIEGMERGLKHVAVTGLLDDGVLYRTPCYTRFGDYPYCSEMRHGVYSVTKSAGAALSLLWLAEKFGPEVLDLKIRDYVDVTADHDGWDDVTFIDAINMATGVGEMAPDRDPRPDGSSFIADEFRHLNRFANVTAMRERLDVAFSIRSYGWGPGEVPRYNSMHTFVLAVAMDAFLKSKEGPDAHLWDRLTEEVLVPIGIRHAPLMHTYEPDGTRGVPIMGWGFYPTIDDLAKIAQLYQDRGAFDGRQLIHGPTIDHLLRGGGEHRRPINWLNDFGEYGYGFSFWYMPYAAEDGCLAFVPEMQGSGGNLVALMPNGMTGIRLADADEGTPGMWDGENMAALADRLRSFCP